MDETERKQRLKKVQNTLQWLWDRIEVKQESGAKHDLKTVAVWRERQELLEAEEHELLEAGRKHDNQ